MLQRTLIVNLSEFKYRLRDNIGENGVNISVVKVNSKNDISVITYKRGVGITQACGTGACASVVASNKLNLVEKKVIVTMSGGSLEIEICQDNNILMIGKADIVYSNSFDHTIDPTSTIQTWRDQLNKT